MIVDSHAHIFPFLGGPSGYTSSEEHMRWLQLYMANHKQPVKRLTDHQVVAETGLSDPELNGPDQLHDVGFNVRENGRFVWRCDGDELYIHFMPPCLQQNASTPEYLLAEMAYAGVDAAVLQNARLYGRLNEYFAAATARYPGRFIPLAEVNEMRLGEEEEISDLVVAVRQHGLKGIYVANRGFFFGEYRQNILDKHAEAYWNVVRDLGIPVFWEITGIPTPSDANLLREIDALNEWAIRYPEIPCVYTHGFKPELLSGNIPEPIERILRNEQFLVEILYPIHWGQEHDYPYTELDPVLRKLYRQVGGKRLVWGSDMPNVQRHCTYRQSLDYLWKGADLGKSSDLELIMGGNIKALFGI